MLQGLAVSRALSLHSKHMMPFSVYNILSPTEETYKKFSGAKAGAEPGPSSQAATMAGKHPPHAMAGHSAAATAATYHMPPGVSQFHHGARGGYCNCGLGNTGGLPAYPDRMRSGAATGWYGANPDLRYSIFAK